MGNRVLIFDNVSNNVSNIVTDLVFPDATTLSVYDLEIRHGLTDSNNFVTIVTEDYSVTTSDRIILCNNTTSFTVGLSAATGTGRIIDVKNINTADVAVDANVAGDSLIDGEDQVVLSQWENITIVDGSAGNYYIL